ncbi:anti-anti-sigma factor [Pseudonocardia kunmingensis]|uniref:Anti-sigma factor antagonist n=1 Tax=Pseudonocardia kunmingensis TaxID=630975 RepID=A0A543CXK2_9PSEU|nr:anti-anti-sigma factor [Pseudonocardia kunmingensis]
MSSGQRPGPGGEALIVTGRAASTDAVVVSVVGEVDMLTAPQLLPAIVEYVAKKPCRLLVVDLTGVTFLGSPGLKVLLEVQAFAGDRELKVRFVTADNRHATRPLEITGLDKMLTSSPSVHDALQELDRAADVD